MRGCARSECRGIGGTVEVVENRRISKGFNKLDFEVCFGGSKQCNLYWISDHVALLLDSNDGYLMIRNAIIRLRNGKIYLQPIPLCKQVCVSKNIVLLNVSETR